MIGNVHALLGRVALFALALSAVTGGYAVAATDTATLTVVVRDPDAALVITDLSVAGAKAYEWGKLAVGELQYVDRTYTFTAVPAAYVGLDYLRTANDDKTRTDSPFISFEVDREVIVYVAYDDRIAQKPGWMAGWVDTGDDLVINDGTNDVTYSLYSKTFQAGTVSLGANEGTAAECMYTVVVRPDTSGTGGGETSSGGCAAPGTGGLLAALLACAVLQLLRRKVAAA